MEEEKAIIVKKNNVGLAVACGVLGLCAGAAVGLLFAPKPGKELRSQLSNRVKAIRTAP